MGKSFGRLDYHIVFATKHRKTCLDAGVLNEIRNCAEQKAGELGLVIHIVNGFEDHIHILLSIPPRYAPADVVKHIKGYSSRMIPAIDWQEGYGAFTVDESSFDRIFNYIKNQREHHSGNDREYVNDGNM